VGAIAENIAVDPAVFPVGFDLLLQDCAQAGASLRDVQHIAGHADPGTTGRYVEPSLEAQRRLIALT
jgi:hypothetical protein